MVQKDGEHGESRLRIDPVLVEKFRRLQGGINEVGTKIIRDLGLRYNYDKSRGTLDIVGPDTEILALAIETLRFWAEDDEFPETGISCQVGYPNRGIVIWRFHGDYAKKFDHLFACEIARLKLFTSVNIKAVPSKRNPEYVELYCHFSMYHQVNVEVIRISKELSKIVQEDFFIPMSDFIKARKFAKSKSANAKVLYALKEYPESKVRVWLIARDQMDVIRAKKEWILHVGIIARDNEFTETTRRDNLFMSASFFGHPSSKLGSEISEQVQIKSKAQTQRREQSQTNQTSSNPLNLSASKLDSKIVSSHKDASPRRPKIDNSNFPRPIYFIYPIQRNNEDPGEDDKTLPVDEDIANLFAANAELLNEEGEEGTLDQSYQTVGGAKWVREDETTLYRARNPAHPFPNRIYVHHQITDNQVKQNQSTMHSQPMTIGKLVEHPEANLIVKERYRSTQLSGSVITSVTDPRQAPVIKKENKGARQGDKASKTQIKINATTRQKRPVVKAKKQPPSIRYNINVNGLDIFMYKQHISKMNNMDALVNVVATTLKEGDLVATTMFEEAGKKVKDEIDVHLSLYGYAKMGENIVTSAGKLHALGLIHVVSPIWQKYTIWQDCASDLHKALYDTLKTAETHKYRKIGIPTIGSGNIQPCTFNLVF